MRTYSVEYTKKAAKALEKLDRPTQLLLYDWIGKHLEGCVNPRVYGRGLTSNRSGQWRYRVGDYRILAKIEDSKVIILVLDVEHRSRVYRA